jgi:hypothetical protein
MPYRRARHEPTPTKADATVHPMIAHVPQRRSASTNATSRPHGMTMPSTDSRVTIDSSLS